MIGDLRVLFRPVPPVANRHKGYVQMKVSVNGTCFCMALKNIDPHSQEELVSVSSTLFRIYKEALLYNKHITAQTLKERYLSAPPVLLYETLRHSNNDTFIKIGKTITYEQYNFQLKTVKLISAFCQLTYGIPDISISVLPENFLNQLHEFLNQQHLIEKKSVKEQLRFISSILLKKHQQGIIRLSASLEKQLISFYIPDKRLLPEHINKLVKIHLAPHLATIRDAFIFSCFTGLSYNAIKVLMNSQVRFVSDGSLWLITNSQQHPLSFLPKEIQKRILNKKKKLLFALPTIQYINKSLRFIAIISNVEIDITFKSAYTYYSSYQFLKMNDKKLL